MKRIIKKIEDSIGIAELNLEKKQESYEDKSEKWQESEKGEIFYEKIEALEELISELQDMQMAVESYIDEN